MKETVVMRYAKSENEVIRKTEVAEIAERQLKASLKENEYLSRRNKMLSSERERLISLVDSRVIPCFFETLIDQQDHLD